MPEEFTNAMETTIIRIGNSKGIIIPAEILKKLSLTEKSSVNLEIDGQTLRIEPASNAKEDPFSKLSGKWGGNSDAHGISEAIRACRVNKNREEQL